MFLKNIFICLSIFLFVLSGCVELRDYTGTREGAFGLDIKKGFGPGADKKDYYVVKKDVNLIIGDTKNEIIFKIGLPDAIDVTLERYERWTYKDEKIKLFFSGNRLKEWSVIKDTPLSTSEVDKGGSR